MPQRLKDRFSIEFHLAKDIGVMVLNGELDNSQQTALKEAFEDAVTNKKCKVVIVDISHITYMASFAVAAVGFYFKELNEHGGFLGVVTENSHALKPFRLAGLTEIIPIFDSIKEALSAIKTQGFC